jgi:hypothetical protein
MAGVIYDGREACNECLNVYRERTVNNHAEERSGGAVAVMELHVRNSWFCIEEKS